MEKPEQSILSFITGLAVGAIAGLLLAPNKGSETQEKLKNQSKKLKDEMGKQLTYLQDKLEHLNENLAKYNKKEKKDGEEIEIKEKA